MTGQQESGAARFRGLLSSWPQAVSLPLLPALWVLHLRRPCTLHTAPPARCGVLGPSRQVRPLSEVSRGVKLWVLPYPQTLTGPMSPHEEMAIRSQKSRGLGAQVRHGHQPGVQGQGVRHPKPELAGQSAFL